MRLLFRLRVSISAIIASILECFKILQYLYINNKTWSVYYAWSYISCVLSTNNTELLHNYFKEPKQIQNKPTNKQKHLFLVLLYYHVLDSRLSVRQIFKVELMSLFQLILNSTLNQCNIFNVEKSTLNQYWILAYLRLTCNIT